MNKKRMLIILFLLMLLNTYAQNPETGNPKWPAKSNGFSIYATTLLGAFTPINISYDYMLHKSRIHIGYTAGTQRV